MGYSTWGGKELDTTEATEHPHIQLIVRIAESQAPPPPKSAELEPAFYQGLQVTCVPIKVSEALLHKSFL